MKNGGWLDGHSDTPKAQTGNKTLSSEYIDISKKYGIPQFTEEYINKAVELNKKYPGSKFVCDANGCADIASQAASGMGYDFGKANAWDYGNRSDILFTNPSYAEELKDPNGPLHNPTSYDVPKEFLGMQNVLIGLNRKNNLLNAEGKKVGNVPNAQQLAAAANKGEANDSYDYANQDLYEGSRGYEHVGYMMGNNNLLHGTAANKDHPAFFVIDDISDGVNLAGYGKYEPVEAIAEPTMVQTLTNKLKSLGTKAEKALFGESDKTTPPTFKKKKNGGWLESYADGGSMQEHQENYNDYKVSAPEGFKGNGHSNIGRNYSPAWGGQFQKGGKLKFLQPTDKNLPEGYRIPYDTPSSERAMSIGGENGEPAYLIPSFKYGKELDDPMGEFRKTGEHLGGPFKTWQEADEWERTVRHPAVEKGENIMFPQEKFAMGGSIPGAVGFTYARHGAPSKGPRRNQTDVTDASAQNGIDMHNNPMLARRVDNPNVNRSYYDPRLNTMNIGTDYNTWKDEYTGELLTGDDLKYHQDKMLAHENYHAIQHSQDRDNYDIAHGTENEQWARMQKRPQMMTTDAVYNNFYNRSDFEDEQDYQEMINSYPESRILNPKLLFDKILDRQRYDNPANLEGEAKFYEDTGVDISKQQSELSLNPTRFQNGGEMRYYQHGLDWKPKGMENGGWLSKYDKAQNGYQTGDKPILGGGKYYTTDNKVVDWGTPEYEAAYNRGEVLSDDGVRSEVTLEGGVLPEIVLQNNYKRGFWEKYRDKIIDENRDAGPLGAAVGAPISAAFSLPQMAVTSLFNNGNPARPSEIVGFDNNEGVFDNPVSFGRHASNFLLDAVTDPVNLIGAGILTKENALAKLAASKESGLLSNAYKYNPWAFKPDPEAYYHRSPNLENIVNKKTGTLQGFGNSEAGIEFSKDAGPGGTGNLFITPNGEVTKLNLKKPANSQLYFAKGTPLDWGRTNMIFDKKTGKMIPGQGYTGPYMAEVKNVPMGASTKGSAPGADVTNIGGYAVSRRPVLLNEAKFYKEDWLKRYKEVPKQEEGGVIKDDMGQWAHPGEITEIGSNNITMQGVPYDVLGISDEGDTKLMKPGKNYKFKGKKVTEYPMANNGMRQEQKGLVNLDQLTNFTNYNKPQPGGWLNKYN
jgi:hypothetical protein